MSGHYQQISSHHDGDDNKGPNHPLIAPSAPSANDPPRLYPILQPPLAYPQPSYIHQPSVPYAIPVNAPGFAPVNNVAENQPIMRPEIPTFDRLESIVKTRRAIFDVRDIISNSYNLVQHNCCSILLLFLFVAVFFVILIVVVAAVGIAPYLESQLSNSTVLAPIDDSQYTSIRPQFFPVHHTAAISAVAYPHHQLLQSMHRRHDWPDDRGMKGEKVDIPLGVVLIIWAAMILFRIFVFGPFAASVYHAIITAIQKNSYIKFSDWFTFFFSSQHYRPFLWFSFVSMIVEFLLSFLSFFQLIFAFFFMFDVIFRLQYPTLPVRKCYKLSFYAVKNHFCQLFALVILLVLMQIVGFLLCFVGLFFTIPIALVAPIFAYHSVVGIHSLQIPAQPILPQQFMMAQPMHQQPFPNHPHPQQPPPSQQYGINV